jgi:NitT/TauT family transport system substrate-binding protein
MMAALLTAGCGLFGGSDSGTDDASTASAKAKGPLEKSTLKVGMMLAIDCAGGQLALQNDLFKEEGLTIEPETIQSGAFAVPKLASGELDISFGNWVSFIKAQTAKTVNLKFLGEAYLSTPNSNFALITAPNSGVNSVKDLPGKTIAVNAKGNINELLIRAVFEANDIKFDDVNVIELPFPQMAAALANGQVQAASLVDPFVSSAQKEIGAKIVTDLTGPGATENFPISGYATTAKFAQENPNTIAAFQRALLKGQQLAADRKNVEAALPKYAKMPAETAAIVRYGTFPTTIDKKRLQRVADLLFSYSMNPKIDVGPLVVPMPAASS